MTLLQLGFIIATATAIPVVAYFWGRSDGAAGPKAELQFLQQQVAQQQKNYETRVKALNAELQQQLSASAARKKSVEKLVSQKHYSIDCFDDAGLRLINETLANTARYAADAVCSADTADRRSCINSPAKDGGDRGTLQ